MAIIALYDVSAYIHRGMAVKEYADATYYNFPIGGLKFLLNRVASDLWGGTQVCLLFDSPTNRKVIFPAYKSNRPQVDYQVRAQLDVLMDICTDCGIPFYKEDNFEADDLIFNASEYFSKDFNRVIIKGDDMDLAHNIERNVDLEPISKDGVTLNISSYQYGVMMGKKIMHNTISAYKVFTGCNSDTVPSFTSEKGIKGEVLYAGFCKLLNSISGLTSQLSKSPKALRIFLNQEFRAGRLTATDMEELEARIGVIYPWSLPEGYTFEAKNRLALNLVELSKVLTVFGDYGGLKSIMMGRSKSVEGLKEYFSEKGKSLRSGAFAADNRISLQQNSVEFSEVNLRDYT